MRAGSTTSVETSMKTSPQNNITPRLLIPRWDEKASAPKLATVVEAL